MKALIIYSHPNPKSFNAAIKEVVKEQLEQKGAEVRIRDLYAISFNPVLSANDFETLNSGKIPEDIAREQAEIAWADLLVFISPVWWLSVTAMLKGYIDRIFTQNFAFRYTHFGMEGLLKTKRALVFTTCGAPEEYGGEKMMQVIKAQIINGYCRMCGISDAKHFNCYGVPYVSDDARKQMLAELATFVAQNA
ncbi:MAG: NAD(P)H-dependent oxidoreductase [Solirubrobacterales bacterium]